VDPSNDGQAAFDARITVVKIHEVRLIIVGAALVVMSPIVVALSVAAGLPWMRWFWVLSIGTLTAGLCLLIGTTAAERTRWRRATTAIARADLESEEELRQ